MRREVQKLYVRISQFYRIKLSYKYALEIWMEKVYNNYLFSYILSEMIIYFWINSYMLQL